MRIILTIALSTLATFVIASCKLPTSYTEHLLLHNNSVIGHIKTSTTINGKNYKKATTADLKVFLFHKASNMTSSGTFNSSGFTPKYFSYKDNHVDKKRRMHNGEQDALSYIMQLQFLLAHGQKNMSIKVFMNNKMQKIYFKTRSKQYLKLNNKKINTILVIGKMPDAVELKLWFAPALNYALVQSQTIKNNKVVLSSELTNYNKTSGCFYAN